MRLFLMLFTACSIFLLPIDISACVGKTLHIGVLPHQEEQMIAELLSQIVSERTGTTVKVTIYKDSTALYEAVRKGDVGLLIESPSSAQMVVRTAREADQQTARADLRKEYRRTLNLIWLETLPLKNEYTPLLSVEVLQSLPALPRLINKLPPALTEEAFQRLLKAYRADEKPKKAARDFLKTKKLI